MDSMQEFNKIDQVLSSRASESLKNAFIDSKDADENTKSLILTSPTDLGVCRNGGRRGTAYGPKAILALLKKASLSSQIEGTICEELVSSDVEELKNFEESQKLEANKIKNAISNFKGQNIIHIGGGHDHVYPFLMGLDKAGKKITVINIDAHMDTRQDLLPHSGTPFRQYDRDGKSELHLIQFGIHPFANSKSTVEPLKNGKMTSLFFKDIRTITHNFTKPMAVVLEDLNIDKDSQIVLSLDTDALASSIMEGVSAVNHDGFTLAHIKEIYDYFRKQNGKIITGIYEYNPVYDNLSAKGARALASLIYEQL